MSITPSQNKDFLPVIYPLDTLEALKDWKPELNPYDAFSVASVQLSGERTKFKQKLLVCHDMKGGYCEDNLIQGGTDPGVYRIWDWDLVDIFVYFSHHLVAIPPPSWTNAAHKHSTKVLGTFITEWEQGESICRELLQDPKFATECAQKLTDIAKYFHFDGWLINIENKICVDKIPLLVAFVENVKNMMHAAVPGSLVIWYDSVTEDGILDWQDALTPKNKCFFDVADGIFTNYSWTKHPEIPEQCATAAAERATDVFIGVDVFKAKNRGTGFECTKPLKVAWSSGCSAALFAPAWVYETHQKPNFEEANERLWEGIRSCVIPLEPALTALPFYTNFDQGVGNGVWIEGVQVASSGWNNLSCQSLQPLSHTYHMSSPDGSYLKASMSFENPFDGGACLSVNGCMASETVIDLTLYKTRMKPLSGSVRLSYTVDLGVSSNLYLALRLLSEDGNSRTAVFNTICESSGVISSRKFLGTIKRTDGTVETLPTVAVRGQKNSEAGKGKELPFHSNASVGGSNWIQLHHIFVLQMESITDVELFFSRTETEDRLILQKIGQNEEIRELQVIDGTREQQVNLDQKTVSVQCKDMLQGEKGGFKARLGSLQISKLECHHHIWDVSFPSHPFTDIVWTLDPELGTQEVSLTLSWNLPATQNCCGCDFNVYDIFVTWEDKEEERMKWLGEAFVPLFRCFEVNFPKGTECVHFLVLPKCTCGARCPLTQASKTVAFKLER